jgi:hypothetical protein
MLRHNEREVGESRERERERERWEGRGEDDSVFVCYILSRNIHTLSREATSLCESILK